MKNDIKNEIMSELKQNIPSNPTQGLSLNNVAPIASNEEIRREIHIEIHIRREIHICTND